jgi:hypothetical protein
MLDTLMKEALERRKKNLEKTRRHIEMGYINGTIHENGSVFTTTPKGIQSWYTTRNLVNKVTEIMDRNEVIGNGRRCHINGKWQLQIRGKHLRRLLKAMPNVRQEGRTLVEIKNGR